MAKPLLDQLCIVTATTDLVRSRACRWSWEATAAHRLQVYCVENGRERPYLGTVPAFAEGVRQALAGGHEIIACFHSDVLIQEDGWDLRVLEHFRTHPNCGLAGFGGAVGLGSDDLYKAPYSPHQLARQGYRSNTSDAEAHGTRTTEVQRVACFDGFSQIGHSAFWTGWRNTPHTQVVRGPNLFARLRDLGITHHLYDGLIGCYAKRLGWEAWLIPVACTHYGGMEAVGDPGYQEWARTQHPEGDQGFWKVAHEIGYREFKDCLPLRVTP